MSGCVNHIISMPVLTGTHWRACQACSLDLLPRDAAYTLKVYLKIVELLHHVGLNVFRSDVLIRGYGSHDLVACFSTMKQCLVRGLVSVELKMRSYHRGHKKVLKKLKEDCEARFQLLKRFPSQVAFQGVLLVVAWSSKVAGGGWAAPNLLMELLTEEGWQRLKASTMPKKRRLRPLPEIFAEMTWHRVPQRDFRMGKVSEFLKALNRTRHDVASLAKVWNRLLADHGSPQRIVKKRIGQRGSTPWVGSKVLFRKIHGLLQAA